MTNKNSNIKSFLLSLVLLATISVMPLEAYKSNQEFYKLEKMMKSFMKKHNVPGASLAIIKDSRLVYANGFGLADKKRKQDVTTNSLFRIASLSKAITGVAILQLVESGKISLDDKVISLLKSRPYNGRSPIDKRWNSVTVKHLLQHEGGWSRKNDVMGQVVTVTKRLKQSRPANARDFVRYKMGRKLDFNPGSKYSYSNFGYNILGRIIEDVTNMSYENYVQNNILFPLGISSMTLAKRDRQYKASNEVTYYDAHNRVARPSFGINKGKKVPITYTNYIEAQDSHGGWIASASDMAKFMSCFDNPNRCSILKPKTIKSMFNRKSGPACYKNSKPKNPYYANGWMVWPKRVGKNIFHFGTLTGTSTAMVTRSDGIGWVILFNMRHNKNKKTLASLIDSKLHKAVKNIDNWPKTDLFQKYGY